MLTEASSGDTDQVGDTRERVCSGCGKGYTAILVRILGLRTYEVPVTLCGCPPTPPRHPLWLFALDNPPMLRRLPERRAQDRLLNFETAHWRKAFTIASSFSRTSGWISSGCITAAIS